jgi:hypothetical protein
LAPTRTRVVMEKGDRLRRLLSAPST